MTSKKFESKTYPPSHYDNCMHRGNSIDYIKNYEQSLRKKYHTSDDLKILIKKGYIIKNDPSKQNLELTQRGKLLDTQFRLYKLIYDEINDEIEKMHQAIARANQDIEILEMQSNSQDVNSLLIQTEVEAIAEKLLSELSNFVQVISLKTYEEVYTDLTESWTNILGNAPDAADDNLINKEIYDTINPWLQSFRTWLFNNINTTFDDSFLTTKGYLQKGLLGDFFENVKNIFSEIKGKVDTLTRNIVSSVQTIAQKIAFKAQRVEKYQVIFSGYPNACEKCKKMSNEKFNIADLVVEDTAPPFHPNCGCTMIPLGQEKKDGSLREQVFIAVNIAFELLAQIEFLENSPIYDWEKSAIYTAGTFYLGSINCPLAAEMYRLGMYGEGKGMSKKATTLMIEAMKKSKHLQDKIFELTEPDKDFDTGSFGFEFKKDEDQDLYYAVQNVNMRIIGTNLGDGTWNIKIISWDEYDFTKFRNSLAFADLANNLGEAMQRNGMMTEYDTRTEFEYTWQRG